MPLTEPIILSEVYRWILGKLDEGMPVPQIIQLLVKKYAVRPDTAARWWREALQIQSAEKGEA